MLGNITTNCSTCGVEISIPRVFYDELQEDGKTFHCLNGHPLHFTDSYKKKFKKAEKERKEAWRYYYEMRDDKEREINRWRGSSNKYKGLYTKEKTDRILAERM